MQIYSYQPFGYEGSLVKVEADVRQGTPAVDIAGLADNLVGQARETVKAALKSDRLEFPAERVLVSLSPADLRKEGDCWSLPIAMGVYNAQMQKGIRDGAMLVMGGLDSWGAIRPVRGVYAACLDAKAAGITECVVCASQACEAREAGMAKVHAVENLRQAVEFLEEA